MSPWKRGRGRCGRLIPREAAKARFPPGIKGPERLLCLQEPSSVPNQLLAPKTSLWSFSVPVLILASSSTAVTASKLRAHSRRSSQRHVHQELIPVHDGMEFRVLPKKVTSDQPILGAEVTIFHHRETIFHHVAPWQWMSARKTIHATRLEVCRIFRMSRTWSVPPPGASSWIGSQDGRLVFKGQTWHKMHQSSGSTEI